MIERTISRKSTVVSSTSNINSNSLRVRPHATTIKKVSSNGANRGKLACGKRYSSRRTLSDGRVSVPPSIVPADGPGELYTAMTIVLRKLLQNEPDYADEELVSPGSSCHVSTVERNDIELFVEEHLTQGRMSLETNRKGKDVYYDDRFDNGCRANRGIPLTLLEASEIFESDMLASSRKAAVECHRLISRFYAELYPTESTSLPASSLSSSQSSAEQERENPQLDSQKCDTPQMSNADHTRTSYLHKLENRSQRRLYQIILSFVTYANKSTHIRFEVAANPDIYCRASLVGRAIEEGTSSKLDNHALMSLGEEYPRQSHNNVVNGVAIAPLARSISELDRLNSFLRDKKVPASTASQIIGTFYLELLIDAGLPPAVCSSRFDGVIMALLEKKAFIVTSLLNTRNALSSMVKDTSPKELLNLVVLGTYSLPKTRAKFYDKLVIEGALNPLLLMTNVNVEAAGEFSEFLYMLDILIYFTAPCLDGSEEYVQSDGTYCVSDSRGGCTSSNKNSEGMPPCAPSSSSSAPSKAIRCTAWTHDAEQLYTILLIVTKTVKRFQEAASRKKRYEMTINSSSRSLLSSSSEKDINNTDFPSKEDVFTKVATVCSQIIVHSQAMAAVVVGVISVHMDEVHSPIAGIFLDPILCIVKRKDALVFDNVIGEWLRTFGCCLMSQPLLERYDPTINILHSNNSNAATETSSCIKNGIAETPYAGVGNAYTNTSSVSQSPLLTTLTIREPLKVVPKRSNNKRKREDDDEGINACVYKELFTTDASTQLYRTGHISSPSPLLLRRRGVGAFVIPFLKFAKDLCLTTSWRFSGVEELLNKTKSACEALVLSEARRPSMLYGVASSCLSAIQPVLAKFNAERAVSVSEGRLRSITSSCYNSVSRCWRMVVNRGVSPVFSGASPLFYDEFSMSPVTTEDTECSPFAGISQGYDSPQKRSQGTCCLKSPEGFPDRREYLEPSTHTGGTESYNVNLPHMDGDCYIGSPTIANTVPWKDRMLLKLFHRASGYMGTDVNPSQKDSNEKEITKVVK